VDPSVEVGASCEIRIVDGCCRVDPVLATFGGRETELAQCGSHVEVVRMEEVSREALGICPQFVDLDEFLFDRIRSKAIDDAPRFIVPSRLLEWNGSSDRCVTSGLIGESNCCLDGDECHGPPLFNGVCTTMVRNRYRTYSTLRPDER